MEVLLVHNSLSVAPWVDKYLLIFEWYRSPPSKMRFSEDSIASDMLMYSLKATVSYMQV